MQSGLGQPINVLSAQQLSRVEKVNSYNSARPFRLGVDKRSLVRLRGTDVLHPHNLHIENRISTLSDKIDSSEWIEELQPQTEKRARDCFVCRNLDHCNVDSLGFPVFASAPMGSAAGKVYGSGPTVKNLNLLVMLTSNSSLFGSQTGSLM